LPRAECQINSREYRFGDDQRAVWPDRQADGLTILLISDRAIDARGSAHARIAAEPRSCRKRTSVSCTSTPMATEARSNGSGFATWARCRSG
jgi:hypothetical protein